MTPYAQGAALAQDYLRRGVAQVTFWCGDGKNMEGARRGFHDTWTAGGGKALQVRTLPIEAYATARLPKPKRRKRR